jgi:hypothetical protein
MKKHSEFKTRATIWWLGIAMGIIIGAFGNMLASSLDRFEASIDTPLLPEQSVVTDTGRKCTIMRERQFSRIIGIICDTPDEEK